MLRSLRVGAGVFPSVLLLSSLVLFIPDASASEACIPAKPWLFQRHGLPVTHPNLPLAGSTYAGTFNAYVDGAGPFAVYCVELDTYLCPDDCYQQGIDVLQDEIVWILDHYYPKVRDLPGGLNHWERGAAVQLALWHFSDGLDISFGGEPSLVFDAARSIIAEASGQVPPPTPAEVIVTPGDEFVEIGSMVNVVVLVLDSNRDPVPGAELKLEITGAHPQIVPGITDNDGIFRHTYRGVKLGADDIVAEVSYRLPVGMRWMNPGCQTLVMGEEAPGAERGRASKRWDTLLPTEEKSWGAIKVRFTER